MRPRYGWARPGTSARRPGAKSAHHGGNISSTPMASRAARTSNRVLRFFIGVLSAAAAGGNSCRRLRPAARLQSPFFVGRTAGVSSLGLNHPVSRSVRGWGEPSNCVAGSAGGLRPGRAFLASCWMSVAISVCGLADGSGEVSPSRPLEGRGAWVWGPWSSPGWRRPVRKRRSRRGRACRLPRQGAVRDSGDRHSQGDDNEAQ